MDGRQGIALVQGVSAHAFAQRITEAGSLVLEKGGVVGGGEALEQSADRGRETVVDFVARGPEGVAAGGWQGVDLEHGIVARDGLKGDVGVPAGRGEARDVGELVGEAAAFFLLFGRDYAYLVAELGAFFCEGVDVEV